MSGFLNPGDTSYKVNDVIRREDILKANGGPGQRRSSRAEYRESHCDYLSAWEEDKYIIAQANVELDGTGRIVPELANARKQGRQLRAEVAR